MRGIILSQPVHSHQTHTNLTTILIVFKVTTLTAGAGHRLHQHSPREKAEQTPSPSALNKHSECSNIPIDTKSITAHNPSDPLISLPDTLPSHHCLIQQSPCLGKGIQTPACSASKCSATLRRGHRAMPSLEDGSNQCHTYPQKAAGA